LAQAEVLKGHGSVLIRAAHAAVGIHNYVLIVAILRPSVQSFFGLFEISLKIQGFLADIRLRAPGLNAGTNVADAVRHSVSEVATRIRQGQDMLAALLAKGACFSGLV
jgi:hypothetical protein